MLFNCSRPGSFGNATTTVGCNECKCNGHGDVELGICDIHNGTCFCKDNTEGHDCENCKKGYYGDPRYDVALILEKREFLNYTKVLLKCWKTQLLQLK